MPGKLPWWSGGENIWYNFYVFMLNPTQAVLTGLEVDWMMHGYHRSESNPVPDTLITGDQLNKYVHSVFFSPFGPSFPILFFRDRILQLQYSMFPYMLCYLTIMRLSAYTLFSYTLMSD